MRVLLTGANGFVGRACLREFCQHDIKVHAMIRPGSTIFDNNKAITWHFCDILNLEEVLKIFKDIKPDFLIHLAWYVEHQLFWHSPLNIPYIAATTHLYEEFSRNGGQKAIFMGTCAEYASTHEICKEDETPLLPDTPYGIAKKQTFEQLTQIRENQSCSPFSWLRIFNLFGPDENPNRLVPYIFGSYLKGQVPHLNSPGAVRDHLYVDNLAFIIMRLLTSAFEGAINVGQGNHLSLLELAHRIHERYFHSLPRLAYPDIIKGNKFLPNLDKLKKLNIELPMSFDLALDKTFHWWTEKLGVNAYV